MKRFFALMLALLLTACARPARMIGAEKAIDIVFPVAAEAADSPITRDMAVCQVVDGCYEITFASKTEETLGFSTIIIVLVDGYTGEIVNTMEAV